MPISQSPGDAAVDVRNVAILLSDIRGFSEIAEAYEASDIVAMLNRYFQSMGDLIEKYNGKIDKLMGDSILVTFGLEDPSDKDVENAIACAVEMQLAMGELNEANKSMGMPEIYQGIGINHGNVVVGDLGSTQYSENTIIGEGVNLTARIEAHCLRGQILISEQTLDVAKDFVEVSPPNSVDVKGAKEPLLLYEVYSICQPKEMVVPRREGRKSPRVQVDMPATFQCLSGKIILPEKIIGRIVDISYHGMLMESDVRLTPLSEIKMRVSLSMFSEETTEIFARIVKSGAHGDVFVSGMEFTFVDQAGQEAIKQLVDRLLFA